jgi:pimeloyl-[acyl-carrier protein] methyl ester esterase
MWRDVGALLPGFRLTSWDRGYFGAHTMPAAEPPLIAVGHSLGALVLALRLPMSIPLVAINGFDRFTGEDAVSPRVLERMRRRFAQTPAVVLNEFREQCGAPPTASAFDEAVLAADLNLLSTARVTDYGRRMLVLHGAADPIIPPAMRQAVFAGAPRAIHAGAGHLLPVTHPVWCAEQIEAFACA